MNIILSDQNSWQISMTSTMPNPKYGVTNVIIDGFYVGGAYLILRYDLSMTPSYLHTRNMHLSKMVQETKKLTRKYIPVTW